MTQADLGTEQWHEWKADLSRILRCSAGFFYQQFARGTRRVVFDGLEPAERFSESIQFEFFEYIYHQLLHKDDEWAAREWFRERYRANAERYCGTGTTNGNRLPLPVHDAPRHAR